MKTVRLFTCENITEAYLIKGRLLNEGIDCFLTNQNFTNLVPLYNNMMGSGIQIIIFEDDYSKAREIIADKIDPDNTELICLNCGSSNIKLGLGKRKRFKIINVIIALISFLPIGNLTPKYFCKDCKTEIN